MNALERKENDEIEGGYAKHFLGVAQFAASKGFIPDGPSVDRQSAPGPDVKQALRVMQVMTNS